MAKRALIFARHRLKDLRERMGFTQHEFALVLGVKEHTVYAWEYGRRTPSIATIGKILTVLQPLGTVLTDLIIETPEGGDAQ